jgi:peptide/nickel transport system substrate-binding protein
VTRVKRSVLSSVAALASVALVAACSGSGSGGKTNSNDVKAPDAKTNNQVNAMATTARSAMKAGGTMTWSLSQTIPNFNYYELDGTLLDTINILNALMPRPFEFNAAGVPKVNTDYFTSIEKKSDSPLTIDYKINPKAKWSDGTALSWEDMADLWKSSNGTNDKYNVSGTQGWDQIDSVTRGADDQEAVVKFAKPYTDWQSLFDPLMPKSLTATPEAFNKAWVSKPAVTAGAFKWGSENKTAHTYTIVRDPAWWGDKAMLNSLTFVVYNDPAAAVQALGSHNLDYDDITFGDEVGNVQAAKRYSGIDIRQAGSNIYRQFTLNTKDPILSDPKVRQAVVLGIDRKQITTALIGKLGGSPSPLQNHFFMKNQAPYKDTCGSFCTYDAAKAKSLLEGAGWTLKGGYYEKAGKQLTLAITIPSQTPNSKAEAEIAQSTLKAAGIKLTLNTVPTNDFFSKYINAGKFQLTTFTWIGTPFPVGGALSIFKYNPKVRGQNYGFGGSEQINQLLASASTATNADEENKLANQASQSMWDNAAWLPLYQKPQATAVNSKLVNIGAYGFASVRYQDIGYKA